MDVDATFIIIKDLRTPIPATSIAPDFASHGSVLGLEPAIRELQCCVRKCQHHSQYTALTGVPCYPEFNQLD